MKPEIMADDIAITATTVRVPVLNGHSESVNIETREKLTADMAREIFQKLQVLKWLMNLNLNGIRFQVMCQAETRWYVGRIREDFSIRNGLNLRIVAANLRKVAALNAVQIAEYMAENGLI